MNKIQKFFAIVKENGGWKSSLFKMYRQDELKTGTLVGTDAFGKRSYFIILFQLFYCFIIELYVCMFPLKGKEMYVSSSLIIIYAAI